MKRFVFCLCFMFAGCHTTPPIAPKTVPTLKPTRSVFYMQSLDYMCPISSMDDLHRGIYLNNRVNAH